jgi:aerobic carbon-monoxide dehydrogenase medium subunit
MKSPDFTYAKAATLAEAFALKQQHGPDARWLAGGQSLLASLAFRLSEPTALIDISRLDELSGITHLGNVISIGAATTHAALGASALICQHAPLVAQAIPQIAHTAIRNRGTIGGSLAFADPAAELPACCVALDATFVIASAHAERRVSASKFFQGVYATELADNEILLAIEIPVHKPDEHHALVEITRRSGDYAMAGIAAIITQPADVVSDARLVFFALGDKPIVAIEAAACLVGHPLDDPAIEQAAKALARDIDPSADLNGSAATKRHLAQVVLLRALTKLSSSISRSVPSQSAS